MGRNMLVDGEWRVDVEPRTTDDGDFERVETTFRDRIGSGGGQGGGQGGDRGRFPVESGRYHLYVSRSCPWAHGAALVRRLCGLDDAVTMDVVDPHREADGWQFTPEKDGCTPDTVLGSEFLREVYTAADPDYTGRVTVPVLFDRERETIVNNESIEIMRTLATAFDTPVDLYPRGYCGEIDDVIERIYGPINDGVYRAGFAETQVAYDRAVDDLFAALDHWDSVLADRRYLAGDRLTLADLRLFPTLIRFDQVYHTKFYCDRRFIHQYGHLWPYLRDLYQTPGVARTVNMDHIEEAYFTNSEEFTPDPVVPSGPELDYGAAHDRDRLPGGPPEALLS